MDRERINMYIRGTGMSNNPSTEPGNEQSNSVTIRHATDKENWDIQQPDTQLENNSERTQLQRSYYMYLEGWSLRRVPKEGRETCWRRVQAKIHTATKVLAIECLSTPCQLCA